MADESWAHSRYDFQQALSPDAPDTTTFNDPRGDFGWIHSYETGSTLDGPGIRVVVFMSGCLLRCLYCHNPDTWHLKDGTRVSFERARTALEAYAGPLRAMGGGLTISGGEPLVQVHFTKRLFAAAKGMGLHTALDTSGFLGSRADDEYLREVTPIFGTISGTSCSYNATELLRVIASKGDDAHEEAERFARELAADEAAPAGLRARAGVVLRAFARGDEHALERVIDLAERALALASDAATG